MGASTYPHDNNALYAKGQDGTAVANTIRTYVGAGVGPEQQTLVNQNYGGYCRHWEQSTFTPYGDCDKELALHDKCGDHNYCYAPWCYVTAACASQDTTKNPRGYTVGPTDAWKNTAGTLLYSYDICGAAACFADDGAAGCPYDPTDNGVERLNCPAFEDPRCLCSGRTPNGNFIGYDGAKTTAQGKHICTQCSSLATTTTVNFGDGTLNSCQVCPTNNPTPACLLPTGGPNRLGAPKGYQYQSSKATINGLCTPTTCFDTFLGGYYKGYDGTTLTAPFYNATVNGQVNDTECAPGYEVYVGEIKITNTGCTSINPYANLTGCIVAPPETSIYNDSNVNRHLCKLEDHHCTSRHGYCKPITTVINSFVWPDITPAIIKRMDGFCYPCPPGAPEGAQNALSISARNTACNNEQECVDECFNAVPSGVTFYDRDTCNDILNDCQKGEFCYGGFCQSCAIVVPTGDADKCSSHVSGQAETNCKANCGRTYKENSEPPTPVNSNYVRFSRLEVLEANNGSTYGGFCTHDDTSKQTVCESGTTNRNSPYFSYNREGGTDTQCSTRACTAGRGVSTAEVRWNPSKDEYVASFCMVTTKNTGGACVYEHTALVNGVSTIFNLAGTCVNGECLPQENQDPAICPDGYVVVKDPNDATKVLYHQPNNGEQCNYSSESEFDRQPRNKNRCGKVGEDNGQHKCEDLPRANKASATMYTHKNDGWGANEDQSISVPWGYAVSYIDEQFLFMMFTENPITPAINNDPDDTLVDIEITVGSLDTIDYKGRALVCDPDMSDVYKEDYGCIIDTFGQFYYQGSNIDFYGFSNDTTKIRHFQAEPNIVAAMPIMLCGSVATRNCFGGVEFSYERSITVAEFCNEQYATCIEVPPATSHGDPIIWTFHDECYDLNKDGLYGATVNPKFSHDVKIGVYNDFMRELVVVDRKDNVILSINSLGEHEIDDKFPYAFSYEEKPCPEEMKQTECQGTFKEWVFDAQEFRYTVHLLRHNYKDAGIPEGDLGYHLDIYPKPYKGLFEDGHLESYSGLFFENPLPEELEYCPGGSERNQGKQ